MSSAATASRHPGWPARPGPLVVRAGTVRLRPVRWRDARAWSETRVRDEAQLRPWEPSGAGTWASRHGVAAWPGLCSGLRSAARKGSLVPFVIEVDGRFAGQLTIGNVVRGALLSAWIGYWVATPLTGGGVATGALALGVDHCLGPVGLHRVEATVRPENGPSRAVLAHVGFRSEGMLRRYLDVDGDWRDHELVAITAEELGESAAGRLVRDGRARWT
ncbi:GNAT family N-acetyltransferase [Rhodococcus aerolatus]